jgi:hypothetical protein
VPSSAANVHPDTDSWSFGLKGKLRGVQGCWVKDMNVLISDGQIRGYKVNVAITFELEE